MDSEKKWILGLCILLLVGVLAGFFTSCRRSIPQVPNNTDYDDDRYDDRDRSRSSDRRTTRVDISGGGDCEDDDECVDQCNELFRSGQSEKDCLALSVNEVDAIFVAFEEEDGLLADPNDNKIHEVHPEAIRLALGIKDDIWSDLVKDYSSKEAEHVLYWIANEVEVFETLILMEDDDEEDFLKDLFKQLKSTVQTALVTEIGDDAEPDETFMYWAAKSNNNKALEIAHIVLAENCSNGAIYSSTKMSEEYEESACTLGEVYCKKDGNEYIFEDIFEDILEEADNDLEEFIEAGGNGTDGLGVPSDDVDDVDGVCRTFCAIKTVPWWNKKATQC